MNKFSRKLVIGTVTVATIATSTGTAYAANAGQQISGRHWRAAAHQALESGDYDQWLKAQQQAFERRTNKDRFAKLQTFHQLLADGREQDAKAFAKTHHLGLSRSRHHH